MDLFIHILFSANLTCISNYCLLLNPHLIPIELLFYLNFKATEITLLDRMNKWAQRFSINYQHYQKQF